MPAHDGLGPDDRNGQASIQLYKGLEQAFNQEPDFSCTPDSERERYSAALHCVAQFVSSIAGRPFGDRFFELGSAIADLNTGTVHPLLQPVEIRNRCSDPSRLWRARAHVALAYVALVKSGVSRSDAIKRIAREFPAVSKLAGKKASTRQTVILGWHKQLRQRRVKNFEAIELFSEGTKRIDALTDHHGLLEFALCQIGEASRDDWVLSPPA
jgi:hypothetical protein